MEGKLRSQTLPVAVSPLQNCTRSTKLLIASTDARPAAITETAGNSRKVISQGLWHSTCPCAVGRKASNGSCPRGWMRWSPDCGCRS